MIREVHVRVCERLRGKFPRSTRLPTSYKSNFAAMEVIAQGAESIEILKLYPNQKG